MKKEDERLGLISPRKNCWIRYAASIMKSHQPSRHSNTIRSSDYYVTSDRNNAVVDSRIIIQE